MGPFYEFISIPDCESDLLVLHELGVMQVDEIGIERWSVDCDIIQGCNIVDKDSLTVKLLDGNSFIISMKSGKRLS